MNINLEIVLPVLAIGMAYIFLKRKRKYKLYQDQKIQDMKIDSYICKSCKKFFKAKFMAAPTECLLCYHKRMKWTC